ncbi:hypothetical protein [Mammaliicoccus vitulinus]|uniref:hypothetical protein n=1 Tax=Mammaliicoccus vitulinus TaxID=71237 RepID=UPI003BA0F558
MNKTSKLVLASAITLTAGTSSLIGSQAHAQSTNDVQPQSEISKELTQEALHKKNYENIKKTIEDDPDKYNPDNIAITQDTTFEELGIDSIDTQLPFTLDLSKNIHAVILTQDVKGSLGDLSQLLKEKYGIDF